MKNMKNQLDEFISIITDNDIIVKEDNRIYVNFTDNFGFEINNFTIYNILAKVYINDKLNNTIELSSHHVTYIYEFYNGSEQIDTSNFNIQIKLFREAIGKEYSYSLTPFKTSEYQIIPCLAYIIQDEDDIDMNIDIDIDELKQDKITPNYCTECGEKIRFDWKYCSNCGKKL